jgi:acyl-CoA thioesterase I
MANMKVLLRAALVASVVAVGVTVGRRVVGALAPWRAPVDGPAAFLAHGRGPATPKVLLCAGDSITHGVLSSNYLDPLRARLGGGVEIVNAGINGNLAWNVLQRLDDIVACRPDAVTLLVGTNDVLASLGPSWESMYRRQQHIPGTPNLTWYVENLRAIIDRLHAETDARLAILDLPPLGEDLDSETNGRILDYNAALREIAADAGVQVLPLHDHLVALLPEGHSPPPFTGRRDLMGSAMARRFLRRRTWDEVSAEHGLAVLTDHVHLNDRAAAVLAGLIESWLASEGLTAPA